MKRKLRILPLILALALAVQLSALANDRPAAKDRAEFYLSALSTSSVQFALAADGEIVTAGGAGVYSYATGEEIDESTMYGVGSVSKMYTTAVVMALVDEGKIDLDAPVVSYIPEFTMADPRYTDITVRMLLNHSSGLMGSTMSDAFLWDDSDSAAHDTLLSDLAAQRLKADPGAFSVYCNDGFTLAEIVAERVAGKSFTELLHEYVTYPLGLQSTKTPLDDFDRDRLARTYSALDYITEMPDETVNTIGTGGVYSTASELALFGLGLVNGETISEQSGLATMEKEYLNGQWYEDDFNTVGYGLGWDSVDLYPFSQYGIRALCKGGDTMQFHASLVVLPEYNIAAAVLSTGGASTYCAMIATEMLLDYLLEAGEIDEILPDIAPEPPVQAALDIDAAALAGLYANYQAGYMVSFDESGTMEMTIPAAGGVSAGTFVYAGDGLWAYETGEIEIFFIEQDGKTYLMQRTLTVIPGLGQSISTVYGAQKLDEYTLSDEILAAWTARNYMTYVCVSEKYSSLTYTYSFPGMAAVLSAENPGYMNAHKITGENDLTAVVQIPMLTGRDLFDFSAYTQDGVEYARYGDMLFMSAAAVPAIYPGSRSICTIQPTGHARWYYMGAEMQDKTVTVVCPEGSGFAYYSAAGVPVNHSAATNVYTFTAEAGGMVVFSGAVGTVFNITVE